MLSGSAQADRLTSNNAQHKMPSKPDWGGQHLQHSLQDSSPETNDLHLEDIWTARHSFLPGLAYQSAKLYQAKGFKPHKAPFTQKGRKQHTQL